MLRFLVAWMATLFLSLAAPAAGADLYGLTDDHRLIRFDPANPGVVKASYEITGLLPGEEIDGITSSGAVLYAMSDARRFYSLSGTGQVVQVMDPLTEPWARWPVPDHLALSTDEKLQVHVLADTDWWWLWQPPAGPPHNFGEVTHVDGAPDPDIIAGTHAGGRELAIDAARDALVSRASVTSHIASYEPIPFETVGPLGVSVDWPVALEGRAMAAGGKLYDVDLDSGAASELGSIGSGVVLRDLAPVEPPLIECHLPREWPAHSVAEGSTKTIAIYRYGDLDGVASVDWALGPYEPRSSWYDAEAEDYDAAGGRLVFAPGEWRKELQVTAHDDADIDYELLRLRLSNPAGAPACSGLDVSIEDDDARLTGAPEGAVGEGIDVPLEATRPPQAGEPRRYDVRVVGGTAQPGVDFTVPESVEVPAGGRSVPVVVHTIVDGPEAEETAVLQLVSADGRAADAGRVTLRLAADLPAPIAVLPDKAAPVLSLLSKTSLRAARRMRLQVRCSEACTVGAELGVVKRTAKRLHVGTRIARGTRRLTSARTATVELRMTAATFRRVRRARSVRATLTLRAVDGAGNAKTLRRAIRLRR